MSDLVVVGGLLVVCSIALIAYSKEIAHLLLFGNTDNENVRYYLCLYQIPELTTQAAINLTIGIAVSAFYFLDFSINAVQASCRALIVDCAPLSQQQLANAWGGRMIGFGNILGYFMGFLNLPLLFPFLGETQLKVLCALATLWFSGTVLTTCITTHEVPYSRQSTSGPESERRAPSLWDPAREILSAMRYLPSQIQAICNVQFFGWLAWFPFLFYSTSWITSKGHLMGEAGINATRDGSLALLIFALISVLVMFLLPHIRQSPGSPSRSYKGIQWRGLSMAWIWALSFWLFALCLFSTFLSNGPVSAIFIIASCGFSWGVTQWVPFTLMGEFVSDGLSNYEAAGNGVTDGFQRDVESHDPLLSSSSVLFEADSMEKDSPQEALSIASKSSSAHAPPLDAGMALGIHNIYIVLPQFLSTFISSLVFMYTGSLKHGEDGSSTVDEFGWVLRIGATAAIVAGFVALRVEEVPESSRNGKKGLD